LKRLARPSVVLKAGAPLTYYLVGNGRGAKMSVVTTAVVASSMDS
jgi:hypothetical protein